MQGNGVLPPEILKIRLPWSVFQHSLCTHNWFFWRPLFTIFLEWCCMLLDFYDLLHHSIIWLLVPLNEGTSVDIFPFTYTKYRNKVSGLVLFLHWFAVSFVWTFFQPFVENAFGAVKTIMILSNISRRLPSNSPLECGCSIGCCEMDCLILAIRTGTMCNIC